MATSVRLRAFVHSLPLPMTLALVTTGHRVEGAQLLGVVAATLHLPHRAVRLRIEWLTSRLTGGRVGGSPVLLRKPQRGG